MIGLNENNITEKEKERLVKSANYPWAEIIGEFEMTEEEKKDAEKTLLKLIEEFAQKTEAKK